MVERRVTSEVITLLGLADKEAMLGHPIAGPS
jgi:hypothetical protein